VTGDADRQASGELLEWEDLGAVPAGRAFVVSLSDLLRRPARFFDRMAVTGGLHEPVTFFLVVLTATVVLAFLAALSFFALAAPDAAQLRAPVYSAYALPPRATMLALVLLPEVLVAGGVAMVVLGTLFHLGVRTCGVKNWEGAVSVWLYAGSAAMAATAAAFAAVFAVSIVGYGLGFVSAAAGSAVLSLARWTWRIALPTGVVAGAVILPVHAATGCRRAFDLEGAVAAAGAAAGLGVVACFAGVCAWGLLSGGTGAGFRVMVACAASAALLAACRVVGAQRSLGGQ